MDHQLGHHAEMVEALTLAKNTIARLIADIEQHHATSTCQSEAIFSAANSEYKQLNTIRQVLTKNSYLE